MKFKWFRARLQFRQHTPANPGYVVGVYKRTADPELFTASVDSPPLEPIKTPNTTKNTKHFTENFANPKTYTAPFKYQNETEDSSDYVPPIQITAKNEYLSTPQLPPLETHPNFTKTDQLLDDYLTQNQKSRPFDDTDDIFGENWNLSNNNNNDNVFDDAISDFPTVRQNSYDSEPDYINEITSTENFETKNEYLTLTSTTDAAGATVDEDRLYLPIKQSPTVIKKDIKRIKQRTRSKDSSSSYEESIGNASTVILPTPRYQKQSLTKEPNSTVSPFYQRQDSQTSFEEDYSSTAANIFIRKGNQKLSTTKNSVKPTPRSQRNLLPTIENDILKVREIKLGSSDYDNVSNSSQTSA